MQSSPAKCECKPPSSGRCDKRCALQDGPGDAAVAALGHASETPERLWNLAMAMTTAEEVASLAASARLAQVCPPVALGGGVSDFKVCSQLFLTRAPVRNKRLQGWLTNRL